MSNEISCSTCKWLSDRGHERTVCTVPYEPHSNDQGQCAWWERLISDADELDDIWCEIQNGFMDNAPNHTYNPPPVRREQVIQMLRRAADLIEQGTVFPEYFFDIYGTKRWVKK